MSMAAADPSPAAVITCARGLRDVACDPDAGHGRSADSVDPGESALVDLDSERRDQAVVAGAERRSDEERGARDRSCRR